MDSIFIEGLKVSGKHGVTEGERKVEQDFELDAILVVHDLTAAAHSDKLEDALDYGPVRDIIVRIVQGDSCYLIERLGYLICKEVLKDKRIHSVELKIRKTAVWDNGVPGLCMTRTNQ